MMAPHPADALKSSFPTSAREDGQHRGLGGAQDSQQPDEIAAPDGRNRDGVRQKKLNAALAMSKGRRSLSRKRRITPTMGTAGGKQCFEVHRA